MDQVVMILLHVGMMGGFSFWLVRKLDRKYVRLSFFICVNGIIIRIIYFLYFHFYSYFFSVLNFLLWKNGYTESLVL